MLDIADHSQIGVRKANLIKALNKYAKGLTSGDEAFNDTQDPYYQALRIQHSFYICFVLFCIQYFLASPHLRMFSVSNVIFQAGGL